MEEIVLRRNISYEKERLDEFYRLLIEYNRRFNLTAITEEREVYYKHFYDSIIGESLFPEGAAVAEVGSGAGFPSVPLCIVRGDLRFTLFESTGKKCEFLKVVAQRLQLNFAVVNLRAEEAGRKREFRETFDVCTARAVAKLNTLSEYCMPLVKKGGRFIAYKGRCEEELKEAERALSVLGGKEVKSYGYDLPENYGRRTIVVCEKRENTPEKYPRGQGKERSQPIA